MTTTKTEIERQETEQRDLVSREADRMTTEQAQKIVSDWQAYHAQRREQVGDKHSMRMYPTLWETTARAAFVKLGHL